MDLQTFNETLATSETPVLVDFWAPWCGPCLRLAPVIDEIAEDYGSDLTVIKVNVDESQDVAEQFGVMSIPTLLVFSGDDPTYATLVGLQPKTAIVETIDLAFAGEAVAVG